LPILPSVGFSWRF